jgi:hypothetical protein
MLRRMTIGLLSDDDLLQIFDLLGIGKSYRSLGVCNPKDRFENLIAALEHRDRILQINIIDSPDSI